MKPKTCIRNTAPMSDTGMATTGTSTERSEPRKRKMTMMTMSSVSPQGLDHVVDRALDVLGRVVGDDGVDLLGELLLELRHLGADALDHVERVGIGERPHAR